MGFLDKAKKAASRTSKNVSESAPTPAASPEEHGQKIGDILQIMQIPATFEIPGDVLMPEDLRDVKFDVQVPSGYDTGQVTKFITQTRASVRFYVELLRQRNEHIAKLATTIDRLQVDANNLRFENEIANGVSLMPTQDDADLENQLMEARLTIRRLEDQLKNAPSIDPSGLSDNERRAYDGLMDELSLSKRQVAALEDENFHLKNRLAQAEDMEEDELDQRPLPAPLSDEELEELGIPMAHSDGEMSLPAVESHSRTIETPLPGFGSSEISSLEEDEEDFALPGLGGALPSYGDYNSFKELKAEEEDDDASHDAAYQELWGNR